jgi:hypothetical protein
MSTTSALEHAIQHVKNGSTVELTTDDVLSMWGLVRAARLDELERENARMRDKLEHLLSIDRQHDRTPRIIDLCYTAFMRAHAKNDEDGGPTDWFTDTYPMIVKAIEKHRAAALAGSAEK